MDRRTWSALPEVIEVEPGSSSAGLDHQEHQEAVDSIDQTSWINSAAFVPRLLLLATSNAALELLYNLYAWQASPRGMRLVMLS